MKLKYHNEKILVKDSVIKFYTVLLFYWGGQRMKYQTVTDRILELISLKREGEYWDFKEQYHNNKADLLHDIICMANNRADQDAYIIFGVSDDYQIKGVNTDENRKTQQQI